MISGRIAFAEMDEVLCQLHDSHFQRIFRGRGYRKIYLGRDWSQYQVITPVGFHWRHIAVVNVKDGKAAKAERYFYSLRAPQVVLPFEAIGRDYLVDALKEMREIKAGRGPARVEGPRLMEIKNQGR